MNRIDPNLPAQAYRTYEIAAPRATHWRDATCDEVGCRHYQHGWRTVVDETTVLGQRQAHHIRRESRRRYTEHRSEAGLTVFEFEAGQPCFAKHRARVERPELYLVRGGDWRGNPLGVQTRRHSRPELWVEDFAENQDRLAMALERG